jgi:dipeptidyl aminopeptidase/acylaminoacyl peptidase
MKSLASSLAALALLIAPWIAFAGTDQPRRFKVRDSIEMAQFAEPGLLSPDERHIATLTERGRIEQNVTEGTVWLFDTDAVRRAISQSHPKALEPTVLVRMSASVNGGAIITRMMWESGSDHLLFLGRNGSENRQLYRVNLLDHKLTALSLPTQDVVDYAISGTHIVYLAAPDVAPEKAWWSNDPSAPDIVVGGRRSIWETLFPNYRRNTRYMPTEFGVWQTGDTPAPTIDATTAKPMQLLASYNLGALGLSHDGSKLILVAHVDRVPQLWESYEVPKGLDNWAYRAHPMMPWPRSATVKTTTRGRCNTRSST